MEFGGMGGRKGGGRFGAGLGGAREGGAGGRAARDLLSSLSSLTCNACSRFHLIAISRVTPTLASRASGGTRFSPDSNEARKRSRCHASVVTRGGKRPLSPSLSRSASVKAVPALVMGSCSRSSPSLCTTVTGSCGKGK